MRKHEAMETDMAAYRGRVEAVSAAAEELEAERYHDVRRVMERRKNVGRLWDILRRSVEERRERLLLHVELQGVLRDLQHLAGWMEEMEVGGGGGMGGGTRGGGGWRGWGVQGVGVGLQWVWGGWGMGGMVGIGRGWRWGWGEMVGFGGGMEVEDGGNGEDGGAGGGVEWGDGGGWGG